MVLIICIMCVCVCVILEQLTKDVLKDLLARYGKVVDKAKEAARLGMTHNESRLAVIKDYDLPISPEQFTQEIMPMFQHKSASPFSIPHSLFIYNAII